MSDPLPKQKSALPTGKPAHKLTDSPPPPTEASGSRLSTLLPPSNENTRHATIESPPNAGSDSETGPNPVHDWSDNLADAFQAMMEAASAMMAGMDTVRTPEQDPIFAGASGSFTRIVSDWMARPHDLAKFQERMARDYLAYWKDVAQACTDDDASSAERAQAGESASADHPHVQPTAAPATEREPIDPRFADATWQTHPYFHALRTAYDLGSRHLREFIAGAETSDERESKRVQFLTEHLIKSLSPSNFLFTNPASIRTTLAERGANLARGMRFLAEDIADGAGEVQLYQTDPTPFRLGDTLAATPGKVVFRNALMELIQYEPTTPRVHAVPLLIVPPWINKYYILDLTPEKSLIAWLVARGITVFCLSWVNPGEKHRTYRFEDYARLGPLAAVNVIQDIVGADKVATAGYCVGGTLLAATQAQMAAAGDSRIAAASFFTTQLDFSLAGDLLHFTSADQIALIEAEMKPLGYLRGSRLKTVFNLMRPEGMIWPYVIQNYHLGTRPRPFDILHWNADSTNITEACLSDYLRDCYLNNALVKNRVKMLGQTVRLSDDTTAKFFMAACDDHIAPAESVLKGIGHYSSPTTFLLSASGHIAGTINSPKRNKYCYWVHAADEGSRMTNRGLQHWLETAEKRAGSWWPFWYTWLTPHLGARNRSPPPLGSARFPPLCAAPGTYVHVREQHESAT